MRYLYSKNFMTNFSINLIRILVRRLSSLYAEQISEKLRKLYCRTCYLSAEACYSKHSGRLTDQFRTPNHLVNVYKQRYSHKVNLLFSSLFQTFDRISNIVVQIFFSKIFIIVIYFCYCGCCKRARLCCHQAVTSVTQYHKPVSN